MWFNLLTVGAAMATGVVGLLPTLAPLLPDNTFAIATVVCGVVNIGLRSITTEAVVFKGLREGE